MAEVRILDEAAVASLVPARPPRGHKGTFGRLLVVAGSLDFAGAALLVCRAAGRAGAGLVTLAVPASLQPIVAGRVMESTTLGLPEREAGEVDPQAALSRLLQQPHEALVVGPGLRRGEGTSRLVLGILAAGGPPGGGSTDDGGGEGGEKPTPEGVTDRAAGPSLADAPPELLTRPAVVDAEALRVLSATANWWRAVRRPLVLTPHPGEFRGLRAGAGHHPAADGDLAGDDGARVRAALAAATEWGQVVVLKGARTVVATPDGQAWVAPFENPALATGGTGDVLAGTIGALLAQGLGTDAAARLGVVLHGLAGEAVRQRLGDAGLLAGDLPEELPLARRRLLELARGAEGQGREAGSEGSETGGAPVGGTAPIGR